MIKRGVIAIIVSLISVTMSYQYIFYQYISPFYCSRVNRILRLTLVWSVLISSGHCLSYMLVVIVSGMQV